MTSWAIGLYPPSRQQWKVKAFGLSNTLCFTSVTLQTYWNSDNFYCWFTTFNTGLNLGYTFCHVALGCLDFLGHLSWSTTCVCSHDIKMWIWSVLSELENRVISFPLDKHTAYIWIQMVKSIASIKFHTEYSIIRIDISHKYLFA